MKFVNAEQIGEKFFEGKGLRYPKKRLKDFVDNDLLFSVLEWGGKKLNYLITENGTKLLQRKGFDVVPFPYVLLWTCCSVFLVHKKHLILSI